MEIDMSYETEEAWKSYRQIQQEIDEFIIHPPEGVEGILQCSKCKSERTYSIQKQVRRADEGYTLFVQCLDCRYQWREN